MRHFTAIITQTDGPAPFEAVTVDLPLPVITGRSLSEVQDNLLTAIQRHIDQTCEARLPGDAPQLNEALQVEREQRLKKSGLVIEIPEYLLTRS